MLSLSRKTDYALVALAGLAGPMPGGASAHQLASRFSLPPAALRNILKRLGRSGVVVSTQGATGGYRLSRPAEQITLGEIVRAVQGPVRLTLCCSNDAGEEQSCRLEDGCRIKAAVRDVHRRLAEFLDQVTLAEIAARSAAQESVQLRGYVVNSHE